MEKGKFYLFKIEGWTDLVSGVVEAIGSEWILIKNVAEDYIFDGYSLIQRKYIKHFVCDDDVLFKERVLLAKGIMYIPVPYNNIPLETQVAPFIWLNEQNLTVQFNPRNSSICYVGKVGKMTKRFFQLISLNSRGEWDANFYKYTFSNIKTIDIDSDYVNSLLIYNRHLKY